MKCGHNPVRKHCAERTQSLDFRLSFVNSSLIRIRRKPPESHRCPPDATITRKKTDIRTITTTAELAEFCELAKAQPLCHAGHRISAREHLLFKALPDSGGAAGGPGPKSAGGPAVLIDPMVDAAVA